MTITPVRARVDLYRGRPGNFYREKNIMCTADLVVVDSDDEFVKLQGSGDVNYSALPTYAIIEMTGLGRTQRKWYTVGAWELSDRHIFCSSNPYEKGDTFHLTMKLDVNFGGRRRGFPYR